MLYDHSCHVCLQVLSGHEGPVVSVAFSPSPASTALASVSWDKTLKLWNAVESGSSHETIELTADGMSVKVVSCLVISLIGVVALHMGT